MQLHNGFWLLSKVLKIILAVMSLWMCALGYAQNQLPSLFASSRVLNLPQPVMMLAAPLGSIQSPDALNNPVLQNQFMPWRPGLELPTSEKQEVWIRLVIPKTEQAQSWAFRIPRLSLEKTTFYRPGTDGSEGAARWVSSAAGVAVPRIEWPTPTRDPVFFLTTRTDQTQLFYIQVQHRIPVTENLQLIHSNDFIDGANRVGTLNGLLIGLFMVLICVGLVAGWINRSPHFYWFSLLAFTVMLTQLTLSGYMALRIWPASIYMARISGWFFPLLSLAALARFCLSISYVKELSVSIFRGLWSLIALCFIAAGMVLVTPQELPQAALNAFFGVSMLSILAAMAWVAWRSQHWLWPIVFSLLPLILSGLARIAYNQGWVAHVELAQLAGVITACLGFLAIYATMILHSRERLTVSLRQQALEVTDASTGLYNERVVVARLPQVILRSQRFQRSCGVMMMRWVDYEHIMPSLNVASRNQIMAHLGSRLQRVTRDIDTTARVGDDLFMILIEAPVSREILSELASKVLTSCMRPSNFIGDGKGYDMHIALWQSGHPEADATQVMELLRTRINQMSHGTQRRVQFIDTALSTAPGPEITNPEEHAQQLLEKINSLEATQGLPTIAMPRRQRTAENTVEEKTQPVPLLGTLDKN